MPHDACWPVQIYDFLRSDFVLPVPRAKGLEMWVVDEDRSADLHNFELARLNQLSDLVIRDPVSATASETLIDSGSKSISTLRSLPRGRNFDRNAPRR